MSDLLRLSVDESRISERTRFELLKPGWRDGGEGSREKGQLSPDHRDLAATISHGQPLRVWRF